MKKKLTIGIAIYNISDCYLKPCIKSVAANHADEIEIILVDDCSDTACAARCAEYAAADSRMILIKNAANTGIGSVRNRIIEEAKGDWIIFVDGDDMIAPHMAANVMSVCDGYDVILCGSQNCSGTDFAIPDAAPSAPQCVPLSESHVKDLAAAAITRRHKSQSDVDDFSFRPGSVCGSAYRRDFLIQNNITFDTRLKTAEDSLFHAAVFLENPRTAVLKTTAYYYRQNPDSVTHRYDPDSKAVTDCYLAVIRDFITKRFEDAPSVIADFQKYRCVFAVFDNFDRNLFHPKNPKPIRVRKQAFDALLHTAPYDKAIENAKASEYENHEAAFKVFLTKRHMFLLLNFCYKNRLIFKIYGGVRHRIQKYKRSVLKWKKGRI